MTRNNSALILPEVNDRSALDNDLDPDTLEEIRQLLVTNNDLLKQIVRTLTVIRTLYITGGGEKKL